jgi:mitogen-activated protein kinase kinase kinase
MLTVASAQIGSSAKPTIPSDISTEADNFLQLTFDLDYEKRPSATECLQHPWLVQKPAKVPRTKASQVEA